MIVQDSFQKLTNNIGFFRGSTNVGLAVAGSTLFLIDSGDCNKDGEALAKAIRSLFPDKSLRAVINTHGHSDHCGGNLALKEEFSCEIWAPKAESMFIENPYLALDIYWGGRHLQDDRVPAFRQIAPCPVDRQLEETEMDEDSISFKTIALPGHFYDQLGIIVTDKSCAQSVCFMGDAFFGIEMIKRYWIPFMQDPKLFRQSVTRIEKEGADIFVPSHGNFFYRNKLGAMAEMNVIMTLEAESLIMKIVKKKASSCEEILQAVADYAGLDMKLSQYVLIGSTIRSYISSLYNEGRLLYFMEGNRLLWKPAE
ncbi:MAG: MBL fold metallo-hydrolase [Treponema sp.]|nr:MBL fold metallo-hydrolase [Treponema sp.]